LTDAQHGDDLHASQATDTGTPGRPRRRPHRAGVVAVLCLTVGAGLVGALLFQYVDVYFAISGQRNVATAAQATRYEITAALCVALLVAGIVAAVVGERGGLAALGTVLLVVGAGVAVVLAVPADRWHTDARVTEPAPRGPICRSGGDSDDCPGG